MALGDMVIDLIFNNLLPLLGGVALFLFGMSVLGEGLEKIAGGSRSNIVGKMTSSKSKAFLLGLGTTAIIQSSSATAVMAVGFLNSGIMTLSQAISVIIGANIGSTATAWILSLSGISGGTSLIFDIFSISTLTPIIALVGVFIFMLTKNSRRKDISTVIIGFGVLMLGMIYMTNAVKPLGDETWFRDLMTMFKNPFLGVLTGMILTMIIQSSSASVGILQVISATGTLSLGAALPIILGQNIGKCLPVLISTIGTGKKAKRSSLAHLLFNIIGTVMILCIYFIIGLFADLTFLDGPADQVTIAIMHTGFNVVTAAVLLPCQSLLEKLTALIIKDDDEKIDILDSLDDHFINTPAIAAARATDVALDMARLSVQSINDALGMINSYNPETDNLVRNKEDRVDKYEDKLGTYLVKLSANSYNMTDAVSKQSAKILHLISDFERISDHAVNLCESSKELYEKKLSFSNDARRELAVLIDAIREILAITLECFENNDDTKASCVEPLEQVVDILKEQIKHRHIERLRKSECTIETGFVLTDIVSNLERVSDHCSNIAGCILEMNRSELDMHKYLGNIKTYDEQFKAKYSEYLSKYSLEGI